MGRVPGNGFATDLGLDEFSRFTVRLYVAQARVVVTDTGIEAEGALARLQLLRHERAVADIAIGAVATSAALGAPPRGPTRRPARGIAVTRRRDAPPTSPAAHAAVHCGSRRA
ncbi:MAG: hypothetical protein GEU94_14925 [Micromonosporaceae bacterium]|nr:hypothetical protein [Micromonosporaceae bacterium]